MQFAILRKKIHHLDRITAHLAGHIAQQGVQTCHLSDRLGTERA